MPEVSGKTISRSEKETVRLGKKFAEGLKRGSVLGLKGNLGTGKTQFVKGICEHFKVEEVVNSPTFIIVNEYNGTDEDGSPVKIFHFDLYRLKNAEELEVIGFEEYLRSDCIVLIEWPEIAEEYLGRELDKMVMEYGENDGERIVYFVDS